MAVLAIGIILLGLVVDSKSNVIKWPDEVISKENVIFEQGMGREDFQNIAVVEHETESTLERDGEDSFSLEQMVGSRLSKRGKEGQKSRWTILQKLWSSFRKDKNSDGTAGEKGKGGLFGTGLFKRSASKTPQPQPQPQPDPLFKHILNGPNGGPVVYKPHPPAGPDGLVCYGKVYDSKAGQWITFNLNSNKCGKH